MKLYELKLIKGGRGVFRVSVVKDGAVEADIVKFSKEEDSEEVLTFADEERQIIYSVAMRPNKIIFRKSVNGEPANVFYSAETVEEAQINYFRNKGNLETNINHSEHVNAQGIFPFESWIVRDPETDKSKALGLETFSGDWVMGYKVDNKEIWDDYIKTGKLDGLSIEATHIKHELINDFKMKKQKKEDKKPSLIDELFGWLKMKKEETEKATPEKTEEELAADALKMAADDAPEKTEEELAAEDDAATEKAAEDDAAAAPAVDDAPTEKEQVLLDKIAALEKEITDLKAKQIETETELETMSKQKPAAEKIKNTPPAEKSVSYEEMTNFQKLKFNREN